MSRLQRLSLIAVMIVLAVSCVRLHGPKDLRRELSAQAGVRLDPETGLTITRSGMWLARCALRWTDDEDVPALRGIRRVEVGVYRVVSAPAEDERPGPLRLSEPAGWSPIATVRDRDGEVLVATRERDGKVDGMMIVVAEADEWVLVRLRGDVGAMIEDAMRFGFERAGRPELADEAIAARADAEPVSPHPAG